MTKAVVFDMYETLVSYYRGDLFQGKQIAEYIGIKEEIFRKIWNPSEDDRTLGNTDFATIIEKILRENKIYNEELYNKTIIKRNIFTKEPFSHIHYEIIPLFEQLKKQNIKIALITNCYFEERDSIKKSELYPYFDEVCMSCELKIKKPNPDIFNICMDKLNIIPCECLYVGDGGSDELECAQSLGMKTCQATWYLNDKFNQPRRPMPQFNQAESPIKILEYL